jgi:hypothetical protein
MTYDDVPPPTHAGFVDRLFPDDFMPKAKGAIVVSDEVTRLAGHRPGSNRPRGWTVRQTGYCRWRGDYMLWVRRCQGGLWTLEREHLVDDSEEALCYFLGSLPVLARTFAAGMRVVEFCHPKAPDTLGWLHWISCT